LPAESINAKEARLELKKILEVTLNENRPAKLLETIETQQ
jgi:hypothetical protein